jgi:hypothetical protein
MSIPAEAIIQAGEQVDSQTEQGLILSEELINSEIERKQWRSPTNTILQQLIVAGNVLEQMLPDNRIRAYRMDQFCQVKDPTGRLLEIVVEEFVFPDNLPEELQALAASADKSSERLSLYTWAKRTPDGKWSIHQELDEHIIERSRGVAKINPFNSLSWGQLIGEDYGRGKVEEHLPDLRALDGLMGSLLSGAAMASRHVTMVRPNAAGGLNLRRRLSKAENGEYVVGNPEDVEMLQFTNTPGLQIAQQEVQRLVTELSAAFLMNSSARRDAERVTATELRLMTEELEGSLGGVFSMLSQDMQKNRIERLIAQMQSNDQLPQWPEGLVEPTILTGLEALGREQDVVRVSQALQALQGFDQQTLEYVKMEELLGKLFNGLQLSDAVRTDEEVQQRQQQQAAAQGQQEIATAGGVAAAQQVAQSVVPQQ